MYLQTAKEGGEGRGLPYYMPSIKANVDKMSSYSMQAWRCVKKLKKTRVRILMTVNQYVIFTIHGRRQNKKGDMGKSESEKKSFRHRFSLQPGAGETKLSPKLLL